jgi:hypothetical protein
VFPLVLGGRETFLGKMSYESVKSRASLGSPWFTIRTWIEARLVGWKCQPTLSVTPLIVLRSWERSLGMAAYTETATVIHAD